MDIYTLAGLAGFGVYVAAYALVQFGVFTGNSLAYTAANTVAAALVLVSLIADFNLASALIQITWITIGVAGTVTRWTATSAEIDSARRGEEIRREFRVIPSLVAE